MKNYVDFLFMKYIRKNSLSYITISLWISIFTMLSVSFLLLGDSFGKSLDHVKNDKVAKEVFIEPKIQGELITPEHIDALQKTGLIEFPDQSDTVNINDVKKTFSIKRNEEVIQKDFSLKFDDSLNDSDTLQYIMISESLANELSIQKNDAITLILPLLSGYQTKPIQSTETSYMYLPFFETIEIESVISEIVKDGESNIVLPLTAKYDIDEALNDSFHKNYLDFSRYSKPMLQGVIKDVDNLDKLRVELDKYNLSYSSIYDATRKQYLGMLSLKNDFLFCIFLFICFCIIMAFFALKFFFIKRSDFLLILKCEKYQVIDVLKFYLMELSYILILLLIFSSILFFIIPMLDNILFNNTYLSAFGTQLGLEEISLLKLNYHHIILVCICYFTIICAMLGYNIFNYKKILENIEKG